MDIAKHLRIFEPAPSDDFVVKRRAAIVELRNQFSKQKTVSDIFAFCSTVISGALLGEILPDRLQDQIFTALRKQSPSLVADDSALEIRICALLAVGELIESGSKSDHWSLSDVIAVAFWSSLDFLPPFEDRKLETLRVELLHAGRKRVLATALTSRDRRPVPPLGPFGDSTSSAEAFVTAVGPMFDALTFNSALDREELDLLWWLHAARSDLLNKRLSALSASTRSVVTGLELGAMMRRLPSQSHNNLAIRDIDDATRLSLTDLIAALGADAESIAAALGDESVVTDAPSVFPLLSSIHGSICSGPAAAQQRSLSDWTSRALLERATVRVQHPANRLK